jgi:outer membrane protein assembly factor BamD (BamD/ComL family)
MIRKGILRSPEAVASQDLYERASRAYSAGRFDDAAEYARNALRASEGSSLHWELLCLRGQSLLRAGHPGAALESFETLLTAEPRGPYTPQALFGTMEAWTALGDAEGSRRARERLLREFPHTPWAERAGFPN